MLRDWVQLCDDYDWGIRQIEIIVTNTIPHYVWMRKI